uniref:Uncharacterized protein n=1 Tax=Heterorhabditis bacteriophora TaxID=37862 RepID=A0A1I7WFI3_HETBA
MKQPPFNCSDCTEIDPVYIYLISTLIIFLDTSSSPFFTDSLTCRRTCRCYVSLRIVVEQIHRCSNFHTMQEENLMVEMLKSNKFECKLLKYFIIFKLFNSSKILVKHLENKDWNNL